MIARVALAAGFGLDLERCDPEVFEALLEALEERWREEKRQDMRARLERMQGS